MNKHCIAVNGCGRVARLAGAARFGHGQPILAMFDGGEAPVKPAETVTIIGVMEGGAPRRFRSRATTTRRSATGTAVRSRLTSPRFSRILTRMSTQSILNEWNYVRNWDTEYVYSIHQILRLKGASFTLACMCEAQKSSIDMLMYYDARPCAFNGLFALYTLEPLKGYYPFLWYGMLYGRREIRAANTAEHIYSLCGIDENGKTLTLLTHYDEDDSAAERSVALDFGRQSVYEVYLLDNAHDGVLLCETSDPVFTLPVHTCLLVKEK